MSATEQDDPQIEAKVEEIWQQLQTDAAMRERARSDLAGTLRTAGLPETAIGRFSLLRAGDAVVTCYRSMECTHYDDGTMLCRLPPMIIPI